MTFYFSNSKLSYYFLLTEEEGEKRGRENERRVENEERAGDKGRIKRKDSENSIRLAEYPSCETSLTVCIPLLDQTICIQKRP